jgi:hypothetical protein
MLQERNIPLPHFGLVSTMVSVTTDLWQVEEQYDSTSRTLLERQIAELNSKLFPIQESTKRKLSPLMQELIRQDNQRMALEIQLTDIIQLINNSLAPSVVRDQNFPRCSQLYKDIAQAKERVSAAEENHRRAAKIAFEEERLQTAPLLIALSTLQQKLEVCNPNPWNVVTEAFEDRLTGAFFCYVVYLHNHLPSFPDYAGSSVKFYDIAQKDIVELIQTIVTWINHNTLDLQIFSELKTQITNNQAQMDRRQHGADWLQPDSRLTPSQLVDAVFGGTIMSRLFHVEIAGPEPTVPDIEERHWYQHSLLIAPTQTGKTNVIQWRINNLLPQIAAGHASLVLIEPKGVMTTDILNLAQTYQMRDRLIILDPADTPVSVNIFDKGDGSPQALTETVGRIVRILGTMTTNLTDLQRDAITFAVRAMFALPEPASARTLMRILRIGKSILPLDSLPTSVREYFEFDYQPSDGRFIISRLNSLLANHIFEALFTGDRTTFDMLKEIQAGKLIIINCASPALAGESRLYARFWIEQVQRCVFPRLQIMPRERRTPTTFIIDEAQDYIAGDRHIAALLAQAAEANIGMMFGMHYLSQLTDAFVKDAVAVNTNLKFAARPSTDTTTLARAMNTEIGFLTSLPAYTFAYRGPGLQEAIRVKFPLVDFSKMPKMTPEQYTAMRQANSRKYAYGPAPAPPPPPEQEPERQTVSVDDLGLADAYAQLAVAIRRGNTKRAQELQDYIASFLKRTQGPESPTAGPRMNPKDTW